MRDEAARAAVRDLIRLIKSYPQINHRQLDSILLRLEMAYEDEEDETPVEVQS